MSVDTRAVHEGDVLRLQAHVEGGTLHLHVAAIQGALGGPGSRQGVPVAGGSLGKRRSRPASAEQEVSFLFVCSLHSICLLLILKIVLRLSIFLVSCFFCDCFLSAIMCYLSYLVVLASHRPSPAYLRVLPMPAFCTVCHAEFVPALQNVPRSPVSHDTAAGRPVRRTRRSVGEEELALLWHFACTAGG